jgi:hypothetical protein
MTIGTFKHAAATLTSASLLLSLATVAQAQGQPASSAPPIRSEVGFGLFTAALPRLSRQRGLRASAPASCAARDVT